MITIEEGLVYTLKHNAGVTALVGGRVYALKKQREVSLPCLCYQRISTARTPTMDDAGGGAHPRFQFTALAASYAEASAILKAARTCLLGYSGTMGAGGSTVNVQAVLPEDETIEPDNTTGAFVGRMDLEIWHEE